MIVRMSKARRTSIVLGLSLPLAVGGTLAATQIATGSSPVPPGPSTRMLHVSGGAIAYDDAGSGPVVICVPSLGDVRAEYRFLRPKLLAAGFRVVTMDLRGQGESSTGFSDYTSPAIGSDILALARHLDAGSVSVVGTSIAGGAAAWAAAQAPDVISRLVLIGPFTRNHGGDAALGLLLNVALRRPWGAAFWTWYFPNLYPDQQPADFKPYLAHLRSSLSESGRLEAMRAMMNRDDSEVERSLERVQAPTLVVMGSRDPDFKNPDEEAAWVAANVHGTVLMVEGAGHYPHAELPEKVGPHIVAFLAGGHAA
jgi:pimeloyl-ACP methyl ester carboxylesterase